MAAVVTKPDVWDDGNGVSFRTLCLKLAEKSFEKKSFAIISSGFRSFFRFLLELNPALISTSSEFYFYSSKKDGKLYSSSFFPLPLLIYCMFGTSCLGLRKKTKENKDIESFKIKTEEKGKSFKPELRNSFSLIITIKSGRKRSPSRLKNVLERVLNCFCILPIFW